MIERWTRVVGVGAILASACGAQVLPPAVGATEASSSPQRPRSVGDDRPMVPLGLARGADAVRVNASCEGCHAAAAEEWRGSLHRAATTDDAFAGAFAREPSPFCRSCHAPEADPEVPPSADVAALGVACVTCHVEGAMGGLEAEDVIVLAAPGTDGAASPHPIERTARLASPAACAPCHEFRFPGATGDADAAFMQTTVREHARSRDAARSCADCHMPLAATGGPRSHAFRGSRDAAWVRAAVDVDVRQTGPTSARITLTARDLGHAFPTGDLFRRVELVLEAQGPDHMTVARAEHVLARHFEDRPAPFGRVLIRDDRVEGEPVQVDLDVGAAGAGLPLVYRVAYQRVAHPVDDEDGRVVLDGEIVLAEGTVTPSSPATAAETAR